VKIAVVGTGYVGLVVGACLAETGNDVVCVDVDEEKIDELRRGRVPIFEPGLEPLVARNLEAGRLRFTTDLPAAVQASEILFIAVGTPQDEDGSADLKHVLQVARDVGRAMEGELIVITKSTVPVGTAARVREAIAGETDHPVHVCSNPEFLKEGAAVEDFMKPDRVVLGVDSEYAAETLRELYAPFVRTGNEILLMDIPSAEITKYAANAMLASRISFMNAVARLCARTGANVDHVRLGLGSDGRIGPAFLFPGAGYGGSCFPKDVKALINTFREMGEDASIFEAVDRVNEDQKRLLLRGVTERFAGEGDADAAGPGSLSGVTVGVWGLSFKPKTDDMREAPSLVTVPGLVERGARVAVHDPEALDAARKHFGSTVEYAERNYDALAGADCLVVHTEWLEYRRPDFERMKEAMARPVIFDGRNLWSPEAMARTGFEYHSVGRPPVRPGEPVPIAGELRSSPGGIER